jgi:hypothetical protein
MSREVVVATKGDYEDRCVVAVFEREEEARVATLLGIADWTVGERLYGPGEMPGADDDNINFDNSAVHTEDADGLRLYEHAGRWAAWKGDDGWVPGAYTSREAVLLAAGIDWARLAELTAPGGAWGFGRPVTVEQVEAESRQPDGPS